MKRISACMGMIILFSLLLMTIDSVADTGTYQIIDYSVALNPGPNGDVVMDYSQTWQVTGGYIPWVTVGLANSNYKITGWGGAAKIVNNGNDGGWYGARVDLNKDYLPNEKFTYNFTIIQRNLIDSRSDGNWIVFTPGWYDRSSIEKMSIKVISPIDLNNVSADPRPSVVEGRTLLFIKNNLGMGERFKVSIKFPKNAFNAIQNKASQNKASNSERNESTSLLFMVLIIGIVIYINYYINKSEDGYQDYSGPVISSGRVRRGIRSHEHHDTGGSGGFGGRASSCACVSCACACACAGGGGGGAGCAKKWLHSCNKCDEAQIPLNETYIGKEETSEHK
jgi:hypothetical protein